MANDFDEFRPRPAANTFGPAPQNRMTPLSQYIQGQMQDAAAGGTVRNNPMAARGILNSQKPVTPEAGAKVINFGQDPTPLVNRGVNQAQQALDALPERYVDTRLFGERPPNAAGVTDKVGAPRMPRMADYNRDTLRAWQGDNIQNQLTPEQYNQHVRQLGNLRGTEAVNALDARARAAAAANVEPLPPSRAPALGPQNFTTQGGPTTPVDYAGQPPRFGVPARGSFAPTQAPLRPGAPIPSDVVEGFGHLGQEMPPNATQQARAFEHFGVGPRGAGGGNVPPGAFDSAPPPAAPSRPGFGGVVAPAGVVGGMMYNANERSKNPADLVYRALGHSQQGRDMLDLKSYPATKDEAINRGLDTAIAMGALGKDLYDNAMHPIDSMKNAVVGNMNGLASAMARGYNYLQGNNERGIKKMPAGPMQIEAPMPAPRDGDSNSPFPDPAATPINSRPANFALDQNDAARQSQRPSLGQVIRGTRVSADNRSPADQRYDEYWKAIAPNGTQDYNRRMSEAYALSHPDEKGSKETLAGLGHVLAGEGSRMTGQAHMTDSRYAGDRARASLMQGQASLNQAQAQSEAAKAAQYAAEHPRETRNPADLAKTGVFNSYLRAIQAEKNRRGPGADTSDLDEKVLSISDRLFGKHTYNTDEVLRNAINGIQLSKE